MRVLIIGSGGREHALAWKVAQSPKVTKVFVAPGNPGTAQEPKTENIALEATDIAGLVNFARGNKIDLTIVGPEAPLSLGIVDQFQAAGLRCFGPTQAAAQLEASKSYAKDFMARHHIPTAAYAVFSDLDQAVAYIHKTGAPLVIKADGLAAGKGVVIAEDKQTALAAVSEMLSGALLGEAGSRVVIEEFLTGEEASFIVMADGEHVLALATSQDHKRRDDGDQGPNTGGMGAYSPAPVVTPAVHARVLREVIEPTLRGMAAEGKPYTGFLYAGLMIAPDGAPKVLEFNCRLGDPEAQPILLRLRSDLVTLTEAALSKRLDQVHAEWDERIALGIVLAAQGYPGTYRKGDVIHGLDKASGGKIFHAGTAHQGKDIVTAGGRVLCACALGESYRATQSNAYQLARSIHWPGMFYRSDIGARALPREKAI